jgi:hypothetical protein
VVHNPGLLPLLAERVIGLKQGRIVFDLPLGQVNDELLAQLYRLGDNDAATPAPVAADSRPVSPVLAAPESTFNPSGVS